MSTKPLIAVKSHVSGSFPLSLSQQIGQGFHLFGHTISRPFQWITKPLIRGVITPLSPDAYDNCQIKAVEVVRRIITVPVCALVSIPFALLSLCGAGIESIGDCLKERPYDYYKGEGEEIRLRDRGPTLMTWNACMFYGGMPMAFGGVSPASVRIDDAASLIKKQGPDILVLQEISFGPSRALYEQLKADYAHFFIRIGPNPARMESCLFVASKCALVSAPRFFAFPDQCGIKRGFFYLETAKFAVVTTHLEPDDADVRAEQFHQVTAKIERLCKKKPCFLLGDLNIARKGSEEDEYSDLEIGKLYEDVYPSLDVGTCTGALNAYMRGKKRPKEFWEIVDYALLKKNPRVSHNFKLRLEVIQHACNLDRPAQALSDHRPLVLVCDAAGTEKKESGCA